MRSIKIVFLLCVVLMLAGLLLHSRILTADGGKPVPDPWTLVADGGKPVPDPWTLVADGGKPVPDPWIGIAS
jgi:hypothetical protein